MNITKHFSLMISWGCMAIILLVPSAALYFLWNIDSFAVIAKQGIELPIHWYTVTQWQWYALWLLTVLYISIGLVGLYFLRRAFKNFAKGELFNLVNSRDIRFFSILLFTQALAKLLHSALSSLLLSLNHPAGEKMLSIEFGSNELKIIALSLIFWVISNLLVEGSKLQTENRQYV